jgi:hypothetical protein
VEHRGGEAPRPECGRVCLVLRIVQAAKKSGEDFDAVPEILETQVFVGGVLIVVVVRDGKGDYRNVVTALEEIYRQAADGSRQADRLVAGGGVRRRIRRS